MSKLVILGTPLVLFMMASKGEEMYNTWDQLPGHMQDQSIDAAIRLGWTKNKGTEVSAKGQRVIDHLTRVALLAQGQKENQ
jgi:hypothetical protein